MLPRIWTMQRGHGTKMTDDLTVDSVAMVESMIVVHDRVSMFVCLTSRPSHVQ